MYEQLRTATEDFPEEHDRKLILADWCEENGREKEGKFWRWMGRKNISARKTHNGFYMWFGKSHKSDINVGRIPGNLFKKLKYYIDEAGFSRRHDRFTTRREADNALMKIWIKK